MPNLVAFARAAGGAFFDRAYAQAPCTEDSVGSVFSSRWPMAFRHGPKNLPPGPTWPAALRSAGWRTAAVVTTGDAGAEVAAGFDSWDDALAARQADPSATSAREATDRAIAELEALARDGPSRPFLLWVHYFDPHIDYVARPDTPFPGDTPWDLYRQEVFATDRELARLLAAVERAGVLERGLLAVTADHGEAFGERGHLVHALWVDELVLRVPLLLAGRGVRAGRYPTRVRLLDLGATLTGFAGDGSPLPFAPEADRDVYAQSTFRGIWIRAAFSQNLKLVQYVQFGSESLYDIAADPGELVDLVEARPDDVRRLRDRLGRELDLALHGRVR